MERSAMLQIYGLRETPISWTAMLHRLSHQGPVTLYRHTGNWIMFLNFGKGMAGPVRERSLHQTSPLEPLSKMIAVGEIAMGRVQGKG